MTAPIADPGPNQVDREPGVTVTLTGGGTDPDGGSIVNHLWTQTGGTPATLAGTSTGPRTYPAPYTVDGEVQTFELVVVDDETESSPPATVTVTVLPAQETVMIDIGGVGVELALELEVVWG